MRYIEKIVRFLIEAIFWVAIFSSPFLIGAVIAVAFYMHAHIIVACIILVIGFICGILFAEYARKKYGCSTFMSRLISTPEVSPNKVNESNRNQN